MENPIMSIMQEVHQESIRESHPNNIGLWICLSQALMSLLLFALHSIYTEDWLFDSIIERDFLTIVISLLNILFLSLTLPLFLASFKVGLAKRSITIISMFVIVSIFSLNTCFGSLYVVFGMGGACANGAIGDGFYLSAMTMATVGYGDCWPTSGWSRIIAMLEAAIGYAVLGVLISSVSFFLDFIKIDSE